MDNSNNQTQILSLMKAAQADVYNDTPCAYWIGVIEYPYGDGSDAWQKSVVSNTYFDPFWGTANTMVALNTVTFTPQYLASHGAAASPRSVSYTAAPALLLPGLFVAVSLSRRRGLSWVTLQRDLSLHRGGMAVDENERPSHPPDSRLPTQGSWSPYLQPAQTVFSPSRRRSSQL